VETSSYDAFNRFSRIAKKVCDRDERTDASRHGHEKNTHHAVKKKWNVIELSTWNHDAMLELGVL